MYVKNSTSTLKKVLLSPPSYLKAVSINEIAKKWGDELDISKMEEEHKQLVRVYQEQGVSVELLPANTHRPNSVFARDFGGCIKEGYILGNFKEPIRYEEKKAYKEKMKELGIPMVVEVKNGIFEGGDFAFLNENTIAIGMVARTNREGVNEIRDGIEPLGYRVIEVPCKKEYLHLDMCFNLVEDHLAVAYKKGLPEHFLDLLEELHIDIIEVEEESIFLHGCNLQSLGDKRVLSLKQNIYVNEKLKRKGMTVIELDITEILKAGGGPHCMSFPLLRY